MIATWIWVLIPLAAIFAGVEAWLTSRSVRLKRERAAISGRALRRPDRRLEERVRCLIDRAFKPSVWRGDRDCATSAGPDPARRGGDEGP